MITKIVQELPFSPCGKTELEPDQNFRSMAETSTNRPTNEFNSDAFYYTYQNTGPVRFQLCGQM